MSIYLPADVTENDIPDAAPDRFMPWDEFVTVHPEYADRIDAAFLLDLANDEERGRDLVAGIEKLKTGDAPPDVVATLAGELRIFRKHAVRKFLTNRGG